MGSKRAGKLPSLKLGMVVHEELMAGRLFSGAMLFQGGYSFATAIVACRS